MYFPAPGWGKGFPTAGRTGKYNLRKVKKHEKLSIALLLAVLMIVAVLPAAVFAVNVLPEAIQNTEWTGIDSSSGKFLLTIEEDSALLVTGDNKLIP